MFPGTAGASQPVGSSTSCGSNGATGNLHTHSIFPLKHHVELPQCLYMFNIVQSVQSFSIIFICFSRLSSTSQLKHRHPKDWSVYAQLQLWSKSHCCRPFEDSKPKNLRNAKALEDVSWRCSAWSLKLSNRFSWLFLSKRFGVLQWLLHCVLRLLHDHYSNIHGPTLHSGKASFCSWVTVSK